MFGSERLKLRGSSFGLFYYVVKGECGFLAPPFLKVDWDFYPFRRTQITGIMIGTRTEPD